MLATAIVASTVIDGSNARLHQKLVQKQHSNNRDKYGNRRKGEAISEVHSITARIPALSPLRMTVSMRTL